MTRVLESLIHVVKEQWRRRRSARVSSSLSYGAKLSVLTLMLLWPAFMNGGPTYFADTVSYLKGGEYAVNYASRLIGSTASLSSTEPVSGAKPQKSTEETKPGVAPHDISGMRSVTYSVFAYILRAPDNTLFQTILVQSLIVSFLIVTLLHLYGIGGQWRLFLLAAAFATLATSASWYVSFAMPDIFAGVGIMGVAMLAAFRRSLNSAAQIAIVTIVVFAVTAHESHIPLIAAVTIAGSASIFVTGQKYDLKQAGAAIAVLAAPFVIGVVIIVSINVVGFGELTVAAKRYPIPLARSIADGPARWHLDEKCAIYQYTVCEVFDEIPDTVRGFLWAPDGLRHRASSEQMQLIRKEEAIILIRAFQDYPVATINNLFGNTMRQSWMIGISDHIFNRDIVRGNQSSFTLTEAKIKSHPPTRQFEAIQYTATLATLGVAAFLLLARGSDVRASDKTLWFVVIIGLAANAAICGAFSGVADRYQGRVIWVLPVCVCAMALRHYANRISKPIV